MADGGQRLGARLKGWLDDVLEFLGVKHLVERYKSRNEDWDNIQSLADLRAWVHRYGNAQPWEISEKALQLGASQDDLLNISHPELTELLDDPSSFLGRLLQEAADSPIIAEFNELFGALVLDPFLAASTRGRIDPTAPEIEAVRNLLGVGQPYRVLGTILNTIGGLTSVGTVQDLGMLFYEVGDAIGSPYTAARVMGPIIDRVILDPLETLANRTFRPAGFTRSQWMDLYAIGKISPQKLGEELANLGNDDQKIQWLLDLAEKQPSHSDVLRMVKEGIASEPMLAESLRREGYSQIWIDRFMRLYLKEETTEEKGAYIGTLRKAFREQLIGESELREALSRQGRSAEAIDLEIAVLKLDWEVESKSAAKSDIRKAYMEDVIGEPEAKHWLEEAGFTTHTIALLLDTWRKERAPAYKKINKAEALNAWAVGVLTRPETYQLLIDLGYDERGATVLMQTYQKTHMQTKPPETYQLKATDIMWAWHTEVLDEDEALRRLVELGFTEDDANLVFETFQRLHPRIVATAPKELKKEDILEAWGRGILDEDTTFSKLLAIGWSEEDANLLMTSFEQRPAALPPEPTIGALIAATRRGVIDQATLSQKLATLGVRQDDIEFWVAYATAPEPESTRQLSRTDILALWTAGRHDRAWALQRLLNMNYSEDDAQDILWLASPEIEDTETYVLWIAGVIDNDIARAMWGSMGFTEEQISEVLEGS